LVGDHLTESGLLDRAVLNREIEIILDGAGGASLIPVLERHLEAFLAEILKGDVPGAAGHVTFLLSLELDDLRRAALLSLLVRLAGKRRFDPVASYVLENRTQTKPPGLTSV
jgi:hypothetical protein